MKLKRLFSRSEKWNFDIDAYTNPHTPLSPLHRLPRPISRFLGYREEQEQDVGDVLGAFWSCVGAFLGLAVVAAVFNNTASIQYHNPPALIASFGASAILEYNTIRSPLGQPRNALLGHTFSALVGVGITKLFLLNPNLDFEKVKWIAGAISCGMASGIMLLTGTVHPPGGASAVLAATSPEITEMGWYFVGLVMWGTTLMLAVGLVVNNIQRQFPVYWWTPVDLGKLQGKEREEDVEAVSDRPGSVEEKHAAHEDEEGKGKWEGITVSASGVSLPEDMSLNQVEAEVLERLRERLKKRMDQGELDRVPSQSATSATSGSDGSILYS